MSRENDAAAGEFLMKRTFTTAQAVCCAVTLLFLLIGMTGCKQLLDQLSGNSSSGSTVTVQTPNGPLSVTCVETDPIGSSFALLHATSLSRDQCVSISSAEQFTGQSFDSQRFSSFIFTNRYQDVVQRLKGQVGIDASVPVTVTPDMQCFAPFGGGLTGFGAIALDGKLLDILNEYSNYLALAADGHTTIGRNVALANIVTAHNSVFCASYDPFFFPAASLSAAEQQNANQFMDSFVGADMFHEFGHYWGWALIIELRASFTPFGQFFIYPTQIEDQADFVSGVLSARARHNIARGQEVYDLMTFQYLNRSAGVIDIALVEQTWQGQFVQSAGNYQSLAGRKNTFARGFASF